MRIALLLAGTLALAACGNRDAEKTATMNEPAAGATAAGNMATANPALAAMVPVEARQGYDVRNVIAGIVDFDQRPLTAFRCYRTPPSPWVRPGTGGRLAHLA